MRLYISSPRYLFGAILFAVIPTFGLSPVEALHDIRSKVIQERLMVDTKTVIMNGQVSPPMMTRDQIFDILDTIALYNTRRLRPLPPVMEYILAHKNEIQKIYHPILDTTLEAYTKDRYTRYLAVRKYEDDVRFSAHEEAMKLIPKGTEIPLPRTSDTYQAIVVDISQQRMYTYEENILVGTSPITSGRKNFSTNLGDFTVKKKELGRTLTSPFQDPKIKYRLHVDYWIQFYKSFGIHDACNSQSCWRKEFGGSDYVTRGSHGCVNTPYEFMGWLYDWVLPGTRVSIIR